MNLQQNDLKAMNAHLKFNKIGSRYSYSNTLNLKQSIKVLNAVNLYRPRPSIRIDEDQHYGSVSGVQDSSHQANAISEQGPYEEGQQNSEYLPNPFDAQAEDLDEFDSTALQYLTEIQQGSFQRLPIQDTSAMEPPSPPPNETQPCKTPSPPPAEPSQPSAHATHASAPPPNKSKRAKTQLRAIDSRGAGGWGVGTGGWGDTDQLSIVESLGESLVTSLQFLGESLVDSGDESDVESGEDNGVTMEGGVVAANASTQSRQNGSQNAPQTNGYTNSAPPRDTASNSTSPSAEVSNSASPSQGVAAGAGEGAVVEGSGGVARGQSTDSGYDSEAVESMDEGQQQEEPVPVTMDGQYPKYDEKAIEDEFHVINLRVYQSKDSCGLETDSDLPLDRGDVIAGRYVVNDYLGQAAFSRAVSAKDLKNGNRSVCLKVIKKSKEYFDQSLNEIKLLQYINSLDPNDEHNLLRFYDYFYFREHLVLVCELLMDNLYEWQRFNREHHIEPYFTLPRIQKVAKQVLTSLAFIHKHDIIHSDLKPENILINDPDEASVKVIDVGSSCFKGDVTRRTYLQSRSYRAPEVILGLPYDSKIDMWSVGAILVELFTSVVLFENQPISTILAVMEGVVGPIPYWMIDQGTYSKYYYTDQLELYQQDRDCQNAEILKPQKPCAGLASKLPGADPLFVDFCTKLLAIDPSERLSATEALRHPWMTKVYKNEGEWEPANWVFRHLQLRGQCVTEEELDILEQYKQRAKLSVLRTEKLLKKNGLPPVYKKMEEVKSCEAQA